MSTFEELVVSRKAWIDDVLQPWCQHAPLRELKKADQEWADIAGKVDPDVTLWTWAWGRFPELVHEGLSGVNETEEVRVTLHDGRTLTGFPEGKRSQKGKLWLVCVCDGIATEEGPFTIDDVADVQKVAAGS